MLSAEQANELAAELHKNARTEWARLRRFVRYARGKQPLPWLPDDVESEYRDIARKSASNWLDLVIRSTCQGLKVDGYGDLSDGSRVWDEAWQANGMDARQHPLHRATESLGYSYLIELPSSEGGVWMRPESATAMFAEYDDPNDEWPTAALRVVSQAGKTGSLSGRFELYDDEARYTITGQLGRGKVEVFAHDLGVTPVVQMASEFNLLGTPMGQIEPVITIQDRIVDATFTLQMVAKYGAFPQRWISGINVANVEDGEAITPQIKAYVDHILMAADPDTKFGQFAAADLRQYVEALEAHIRHLAAITQTPPHYLLGSLVNLSAEALAAAESGLQRKIRDKQEVLGEGYEQALRLAAGILGDDDAAMDTTSQIHWQDVESRSLAQTADALVKLKTIGVPSVQLFQMIPGWTKTDAQEAADAIIAGDPVDRLLAELEAGVSSPDGINA